MLPSAFLPFYPKQVPRPLQAEASNAARDEKAKGAAAPNEGILVWVGGGLVPRDMAKVSGSRSGVGRLSPWPAGWFYDEEAAINRPRSAGRKSRVHAAFS